MHCTSEKNAKCFFVGDLLIRSAALGWGIILLILQMREVKFKGLRRCGLQGYHSGLGRSPTLESLVGQASAGSSRQSWPLLNCCQEGPEIDSGGQGKASLQIPFQPWPRCLLLGTCVNYPACSCPSLLPGYPTSQTERHGVERLPLTSAFLSQQEAQWW